MASELSPELLTLLRFDLARWQAPLAAAAREFSLDQNPQRLAAFLATLSHESNGGQRLTESLDYSAGRLAAVWPRRFAGPGNLPNATAQRLAHDPEAIANAVYADRMGNGSPESGDGWRYRGRGPIQLTGADNYRAAGTALGCDLVANPDQLLDPAIGARAAAWFWTRKGCNEPADRGDMIGVTRLVNGGTLGLAERTALYARALALLTRQSAPTPALPT